ncbi:D-mannonate dehydratase [Pelagirhabdus alkalitolerans]|uniref:Mannonate dehydratase n=1 Tax=Pelagirhabdus alkalitolerans TaxID=1612202 RepID=A0A1G6JUT5_9BACI|nr:mannonate dehydratase [Pelagirhabdus alkalitolerans]SDC21756.1 D-mannonate dehydratase [Pelagirhabdus alkalitolerans]
MKMTFRWFGRDDKIPLNYIKQIPGMTGVVGGIFHIPAGEDWPEEDIDELVNKAKEANLELEVIESVNVHDDIKLGLPSRDQYIENYKSTMRKLSKRGVKVICYNFMPIFDWTRSDLAMPLPDGSTALSYERDKVEGIDPNELIDRISKESKGHAMPGWEPERLAHIATLFEQYDGMTEEGLFNNLVYFLEQVIPVAKECDIKMAIHPDDPPWSVFNLPRIVKNEADINRILQAVDEPENGITLCSGSLGANRDNDLPQIFDQVIQRDRAPFIHIRNVTHNEKGDFHEVDHREYSGSVDVRKLISVLHQHDYKGYVRPDHGRMIWGEDSRPGYGLYDRALGAVYMQGIWDCLEEERS